MIGYMIAKGTLQGGLDALAAEKERMKRTMILNTTRSLFKAPALDLNSPEQLEIDKTKLEAWRDKMALRELEKK